MMTILTLIQDNCPEIKDFFESISFLNANVIVVNLGSTRATTSICEEYGANIIYLGFENDYSNALNLAIKQGPSGYYFYMNPWEQLQSIKLDNLNKRAYNVSVISNNILVKEPRIWNKGTGIHFKNPVYQTLTEKTDHFCDCVLISKPEKDLDRRLSLITKWHLKEPNNPDVFYYHAACLLAMGKHKDFLNVSERYMRLSRGKTVAATMNKYYYSMVKSLINKQNIPAVQNLIQCLGVNPLMAEFWCLLGDIYYQNIKRYDMAKEFYENAIILGASRPKEDKWPIDVSKYEEYPQKMIESCKNMILNRVVFKPL